MAMAIYIYSFRSCSMVFQGTIPVSIGLLGTDWALAPTALITMVLAVAAQATFLFGAGCCRAVSGDPGCSGRYYPLYRVCVVPIWLVTSKEGLFSDTCF